MGLLKDAQIRPSLTRSGSSRDGVLRPTDVTQIFVQLESLNEKKRPAWTQGDITPGTAFIVGELRTAR